MAETRRGWMVCGANNEPCGQVCATEAEARRELRPYPLGCGYHIRPVEVTIVVHGSPPQPWVFRAFLASPEGAPTREEPDEYTPEELACRGCDGPCGCCFPWWRFIPDYDNPAVPAAPAPPCMEPTS